MGCRITAAAGCHGVPMRGCHSVTDQRLPQCDSPTDKNSFTAQYPALTKSDLQICCLTKQGFSNQVISIQMNLQTNTCTLHKSRIKQEKMNGLEDERSFEEIINEL